MGKYSGAMSSKEACELEIAGCTEILDKYPQISQEDCDEITGMIRQAYYLLGKSYETGRQMEAFIKDELGEPALQRFFNITVTKCEEPGSELKKVLDENTTNIFKRVK